MSTDPLYTSDGVPKWQLKQNNQFFPRFRCIVRLYPAGTRAKVVFELIPAASVAMPSPVPAVKFGPERITPNQHYLDIPVKRSQLQVGGTFVIRARLETGAVPPRETPQFVLELR